MNNQLSFLEKDNQFFMEEVFKRMFERDSGKRPSLEKLVGYAKETGLTHLLHRLDILEEEYLKDKGGVNE